MPMRLKQKADDAGARGQEVVDRWTEKSVDWYSENAPPDTEEA